MPFEVVARFLSAVAWCAAVMGIELGIGRGCLRGDNLLKTGRTVHDGARLRLITNHVLAAYWAGVFEFAHGCGGKIPHSGDMGNALFAWDCDKIHKEGVEKAPNSNIQASAFAKGTSVRPPARQAREAPVNGGSRRAVGLVPWLKFPCIVLAQLEPTDVGCYEIKGVGAQGGLGISLQKSVCIGGVLWF